MLLRHFFFCLFFLFIHCIYSHAITKNIILFTFPGGKSHCFIFKSLIFTTLSKLKVERPNTHYVFHILVHNYDVDLWKELEDNEDVKIYGFCSISNYNKVFLTAMAYAKEDPIFGYNKFNEAMIFINDEFLNSGILEQLQKMPRFDLIITDGNDIETGTDEKIDVYSYGMVLWELFTNTTPFDVELPQVISYVVEQKLRPKIESNIDKEIAELIRTCWETESKKRPSLDTIILTLSKKM